MAAGIGDHVKTYKSQLHGQQIMQAVHKRCCLTLASPATPSLTDISLQHATQVLCTTRQRMVAFAHCAFAATKAHFGPLLPKYWSCDWVSAHYLRIYCFLA